MILDIATVSSVYSGVDGRCCCGCSGKHTYASQNQGWASKNRGYDVTDDEVSDRTIKTIVNKMERILGSGGKVDHHCNTFLSVVKGSRLYIAYFRTENKEAQP